MGPRECGVFFWLGFTLLDGSPGPSTQDGCSAFLPFFGRTGISTAERNVYQTLGLVQHVNVGSLFRTPFLTKVPHPPPEVFMERKRVRSHSVSFSLFPDRRTPFRGPPFLRGPSLFPLLSVSYVILLHRSLFALRDAVHPPLKVQRTARLSLLFELRAFLWIPFRPHWSMRGDLRPFGNSEAEDLHVPLFPG